MSDPMPSAVSADPQSNALISSPNLLCGSTQEYTFCGPTAQGGDFYLAIPSDPKSPQSSDMGRIQNWFGKTNTEPELIERPPAEIDIKPAARLYKVTQLLPAIVREENGSQEGYVGPNCYQAALAASGYLVRGRYVGADEFRYFLKRDFEQTYCRDAQAWLFNPNAYGSIVVYGTGTSAFEAGAHAAFNLLGGLIFHKGSWQTNCPYEAATIDGAMESVAKCWIPPRDDESGGPPEDPISGKKFDHICYGKRPTPVERITGSKPGDRAWYIPLFKYYSRRIDEMSKVQQSDFRKKRIDLLTVENMWRIIGDFGRRVGNINTIDALLSLDIAVAEVYLKIESLDWQYQVMTATYDPVSRWSPGKWLANLYRERYVTFGEDFYEELNLVLSLWCVPTDSWKKITDAFVAKIKSFDPVAFAQSNGTNGIPYFDTLDEAVRSAVPRWQHPGGFGDSGKFFALKEGRGRVSVHDRHEKIFTKRRHSPAK